MIYAPNMVLTASHVLEREEDLAVGTHDERTLPAGFVGRDPSTDLTVLRLEGLGIDAAGAIKPLFEKQSLRYKNAFP